MLFFIIRPHRLRRKTKAAYEAIERKMKSAGLDYKIEASEYAGHSRLLAQQAIDMGAKYVIACGGDGTVHEIAGTLMNSGIPMGILPIGTGNDFARGINIPKSFEAALDIIIEGKISTIDMGVVCNQPYINVAGIGYDADVVAFTERIKDMNMNGMLAYKLGALLMLFMMKYRVMTIHVDGKTFQKKALFVSVANGRMIGGGMKVAPEAMLDDGLFDVCIVNAIPKLKIIALLPQFIKGKHIEMNDICEYIRAYKVEVKCDEIINLQLDGELLKEKEAHFTLNPASLKIISPACDAIKNSKAI